MLRWYRYVSIPSVMPFCLPANEIVSEKGCRWWSRLVNYTPLATVIRLISLNCINLWLSMYIISFTGYDPELYLLAWIIIASVSSSTLKQSVRWHCLDFVDCLHCSGFCHEQFGSWWKWAQAVSGNPSVTFLSVVECWDLAMKFSFLRLCRWVSCRSWQWCVAWRLCTNWSIDKRK